MGQTDRMTRPLADGPASDGQLQDISCRRVLIPASGRTAITDTLNRPTAPTVDFGPLIG